MEWVRGRWDEGCRDKEGAGGVGEGRHGDGGIPLRWLDDDGSEWLTAWAVACRVRPVG